MPLAILKSFTRYSIISLISALALLIFSPAALASSNAELCGEVPRSSFVNIESGKALLIAIDEYLDEGIPNLKGTVNDACALRRLLIQKYGFQDEYIKLLFDDAATEKSIRASLDNLVSERNAELDIVVFYAGHGSQLPDDNKDEADKADETILPYDAVFKGGRTDIRDDDLGKYFGQIADTSKSLSVIFDSCHSGTATRSRLRARHVERGLEFSDAASLSESLIDLPAAADRRESNFLFISSASSNQKAKEVNKNGHSRGAFSHAFTKLLESKSNNLSVQELIALAKIELEKAGIRNQTPTVEGGASNESFLERRLQVGESVDASSTGIEAFSIGGSPTRFSIASGEINGETIGSIYESKDELHTARVVSTSSTSSVLGFNSPIPKSSIWVSKTSHNYVNENARIYLAPFARENFQSKFIEAGLSDWLTLDPENAIFVLDADHETTFDLMDAVIRDAGGEALTRKIQPDEILSKIKAWDRWRRFRELSGSGQTLLVKSEFIGSKCFQFRLFPSQTHACVNPGRNGPKVRVTNMTEKNIFLNFIALNPTGSITQSGTPIRLLPHAKYTSPTLGIIPAEKRDETVLIKVFASENKTDLSAFQQGELRREGAMNCDSSNLDELNQLLCSFDEITRGNTKVDTDNWSVDDLSIRIKAK